MTKSFVPPRLNRKPRSRTPPEDTPSKPQLRAIELSEYSADDFVIPASDDKGHSARLTIRYPTTLEREVDTIIASRLFPFSDKSDLGRWCVYEGLKALTSLERVPNSVMAQAEAAARIGRTVLFHAEYEKTFDVLDQAFGVLRGKGAIGEIRRMYAEVKHEIGQMPDGYWRNQYLGQLQSRFGHLVGDTPPARSTEPGPGPIAIVPAPGSPATLPPAAPGPRRAMMSALPADAAEEDAADVG
jgi:hypothetical protein